MTEPKKVLTSNFPWPPASRMTLAVGSELGVVSTNFRLSPLLVMFSSVSSDA